MWSKGLTEVIKYILIRDINPVLKIELRKRWMSSEPRKRVAALWGNGDFGRLGLGSSVSQWRPVVCSAFENQSVKAIACGGAHTLFLTENGRVYATGLNDFGQLGISENTSYSLEPVEVCGIEREVVQISTGYHHSCAITVDGELYMWGKNSNGQLGLGKKAAKIAPFPTKIECLSGIFIKLAALGSEHSVAVTGLELKRQILFYMFVSSCFFLFRNARGKYFFGLDCLYFSPVGGEVLSWGEGGSGRLGHGHETSILGFLRNASEYTPRLIKKLERVKVKNAAAGLLHSACIDESGCVFIFGERAADKMVFRERNNPTTPSLISELPLSKEVACGGYHTCVVTSGGDLYTWGSNENGCLGTSPSDAFHSPERVQGPFLGSPVNKVSCGWKHTAAISEGNVFTWGWGGSHGTFSEDGHSSGGQLGHGSDIDFIQPTMVNFGKNVKALQVSCGFNHTGAILEYV